MYRFLVPDETFKELNIPISPIMRKEMDNRTRKNEKLEDIYVWNGRILTGYEQDDLCIKYHRIFTAKEMFFHRKSEAIAWVCQQQLKRTDLCWSAKAWLISRLYEALRKTEQRKSAKDEFQYKKLSPSTFASPFPDRKKESVSLLRQLGEQYQCHKDSIRRYVKYGRELDILEEKVPGIRIRILTGNLIALIQDMAALAKMPAEELQKAAGDPKCKKLIPPREPPKQNTEKDSRPKLNIHLEPGIKQMPVYDPDADLNGLTYTIMAWIRTVKRTIEKGDFRNATPQSRENLNRTLRALVFQINDLYNTLEEQEHE